MATRQNYYSNPAFCQKSEFYSPQNSQQRCISPRNRALSPERRIPPVGAHKPVLTEDYDINRVGEIPPKVGPKPRTLQRKHSVKNYNDNESLSAQIKIYNEETLSAQSNFDNSHEEILTDDVSSNGNTKYYNGNVPEGYEQDNTNYVRNTHHINSNIDDQENCRYEINNGNSNNTKENSRFVRNTKDRYASIPLEDPIRQVPPNLHHRYGQMPTEVNAERPKSRYEYIPMHDGGNGYPSSPRKKQQFQEEDVQVSGRIHRYAVIPSEEMENSKERYAPQIEKPSERYALVPVSEIKPNSRYAVIPADEVSQVVNSRYGPVPSDNNPRYVQIPPDVHQIKPNPRYAQIPGDEINLVKPNPRYAVVPSAEDSPNRGRYDYIPEDPRIYQEVNQGSQNIPRRPQMYYQTTPTKVTSPASQRRGNPAATQKLHELLTTPKKNLQTPPKVLSPSPRRAISPQSNDPFFTPNNSPSNAPIHQTPHLNSHQIPRPTPKAQQKLNYTLSTRQNTDKRHTAIIAPICSSPVQSVYSETTFSNKTESWMNLSMQKPPVQATLAVAAVMMILCGALTSGLCFYMMSVVGRMYYLDFGIVSGFACLFLGYLGFRSRNCHWLPNRNYISGYIVLSAFSLLTCAGLLVLLFLQPKPGSPLADVTSGAVCGISGLSLILASAGVIASYCCKYPPPDNRVQHCVQGFTV